MFKRFLAKATFISVQQLNSFLLICTLSTASLVVGGQVSAALAASAGSEKNKAKEGTTIPRGGTKSSPKNLHRLDFVLTHASCPSCILKVRAALRATPGVEKCEIALRKPYGGAVVYVPGQVSIDKLRDVATKADPNKIVELSDILEKPIESVPELLVPSYMFKRE